MFANQDGTTVQASKTTMVKELPRQLPKGVDAKDLEEKAESSGNAMLAFIIIQLLLSIFLKGIMDLLFSLFLTL